MISKVKNAMSTLVGGIMPHGHQHGSASIQHSGSEGLPVRFPYSRPDFLDLPVDQLQYANDHGSRPILTPQRDCRLPWRTGYAEVVNAGKSLLNEDQACCEVLFLRRSNVKQPSSSSVEEEAQQQGIPLHFWALYDGHAGSGAAIMASKFLHHVIKDQLTDILHLLENPDTAPPICLGKNGSPLQPELKTVASQGEDPETPSDPTTRFHLEKAVSLESLIMGTIETAFKQMDEQIEKEKASFSISGGCCALVVIHLMGKLYVANAGDSRAIIIHNDEVIPMSSEFTPETERQRLQYLGFLKPELLGNEFTHVEFPRRMQHKELGKKMLFRDHTMTGWAYKTIHEEDLKFPLIYGEGKKARVMATIGVTRGLGDHDLKVYNSNIYIKPFLSCCPEVKVFDMTQHEFGPNDVMVLGTDGLWDVTTNREVADAVTALLSHYKPNDPLRYTLAAQDLVMRSRGVLKERGWRLANDKLGSGDDISVFVIPLNGHAAET
ncbi:protein phosphatase 1H isoform X2 [Lepisosteus oculatus]|uniref:protein phosphatase 1H isoform X2 n=1 Tax=Lepisosteus oculatus TaxID=7918 RepID=UPI003721BB6F